MTLTTLATGSDGNCYILEDSEKQMLILDAGIKFDDIVKYINFRLIDINAVCVTHSHKDHSAARGKFRKIGVKIIDKPGEYTVGRYKIKTFDLVHDVPCIGFYIWHPEMGSMVYLTDTEYCKYRFSRIRHILVECNYDKNYLSHEHPAKDHIITGHMELETVADFIKANKSERLKKVILCHMSHSNLDFDIALKTIQNIHSDTQFAVVGERIDL